MATKNDITGDSLRSKASTKKYNEGWDRIFGKKKEKECEVCGLKGQHKMSCPKQYNGD